MKKFIPLICTILIGICVNSLYAQNNTTYYRYFTIECKKVNTTDFNLLKSNGAAAEPISFRDVCGASSKMLVAVDASYPKRIEDIEAEIRAKIHTKLPKTKIKSIRVISASDKQTFCE